MAEKQLDQELTQTEQRQSRLKELIAKGKEQGLSLIHISEPTRH